MAYRYLPERNPGVHIEGVPLRDLTDDDLAGLPEHILGAIAAAPFYAPDDAAGFVPPAVADAAERQTRRRGAVDTKDLAAASAAASTDVAQE